MVDNDLRHFAIFVTVSLVLGCGGDFVTFGAGSVAGAGGHGAGGHGAANTTAGSGGVPSTNMVSVTSTTASGTGAGGAPAPPCHPPGLVDTFDGNAVDLNRWATQGKVDNIAVYRGRLHFIPQDGIPNGQWTGMTTNQSYDVTKCAVWLMVPSLVTNGQQGFSYFQLYHSDGQAAFRVDEGELLARIGGQETVVPYTMASHRWWRIRESGGTLYLETSPDAHSWTVIHSGVTPPWINDVTVGIGTVSPSNGAKLGETQWDNLNAMP